MLSTPARKMQDKTKTTKTLVKGTSELSPCGKREAMSGTRYVQSALSSTYPRGVLQFPWVWIYHSFAVCKGDIRIVCLFAMTAGILLWEKTFGMWLRPLFTGSLRIPAKC